MADVRRSSSGKLVHVKFTQQYCTGISKVPNNFRVFGRYTICENGTRRRSKSPCRVYIVFQRDGYAMERSAPSTARELVLELRGVLKG